MESRFALAHALRDHAGNSVARRALQKALRWIVEAQIHQRDPGAAAATARELDPPDPEVMARVARLEAEVEEARRLEQLGRDEERERDPRGAARGLGAVLAVCAVGMVGLILYAGSQDERQALSMWHIAIFDGFVLLAAGAAALFFRRRLLANRAGRSLTSALFAILAGASVIDVAAAMRGWTPDQAGPMTMIGLAIGFAVSAAAFGRAFYLSAGAMLVGAAVSLVRPEATGAAVTLATLGALAIAVRELLAKAPPDRP